MGCWLVAMSELQIWLIILGGMIVTYITRLSFIMFIPPDRMPDIVGRGLRTIPPAVLAAILLPELVLTEGALNISFANPRLMAGLIAALFAWRLRNTWLTIAAGMIALWILLSLLGAD